MKKVFFTRDGFNYASLIRDNDTDPTAGIIQAPPDIRQLDWELIQRKLHNELLERGLLTLKDVQIRQNEFNKIVLSAVGKPLMNLYQEETWHSL